MVYVKSTSSIIPSKPTPGGVLRLSECDQRMQWTHIPLIFIYKATGDNNEKTKTVVETLKDSLSRVLVPYYPLAGRLHWIHGGRLEVHCNAKGAQLLEAYSEAKLDELGDFAPMKAIEDLVPKVDYGSPIEDWPLLLVQVTRFSCGGLCVATAMSHTMVDGWSAAKFFNAWAKLARGDELEENEMPFHDRTILRSLHEPLMPPRFEHIEFTKPPLRLGHTDAKEEKKKETCVAILKVTKEQVEGLRKKANAIPCQDVETVSTRPFSRYEAIASHLWRCICKARANDNSQPTRVTLVIDFRSRLKPSLPPGYFGNTVLQTVTSKCVHGDLLAKPLSYAAGKLREAIERMTDEYIRSALDFIASQKDVGALRCGLHNGAHTNPPNYLGNPNASILSWINLPFYGMDYGWGKPIYVGPALINDDDGKTYIMSSPAADGSLIIALRLQTECMNSFKEFFYEDMPW
ncbi:spermidine hydroxycinnamoyl transferase-like [Juglans regia]|uniref:Spermidine hydroxycinnamoyl transferase-like n=2 Tax=Juglans regia TaxID=51240 RepID=A0A2I4ECW7_JUGRE|nr:spermidine hydroxycinnamoyl transferase-like [Juglans regia]